MGIISTILNILGCKGQSKNDSDELSKEFLEQMDESINAFKNRKIYKEFTEQDIDAIPDDTILQAVFDNLSEKQPSDYEKEYETVLSWNKARQAIYIIWILEAEVNNGGFNQFYFNSSGQFYKHLAEALKLVGAEHFANLTERANQIYEENKDRLEEFDDGSIESFSESYKDNPLNDLDTEFYELYKSENLEQLQVKYIKDNWTKFTAKRKE